MWRWLAADAIRPWRHRSWLFPRDPDLATTAGPILDLYAGLCQGEPMASDDYVLSADEKTSIQARRRRHAPLPPGQLDGLPQLVVDNSQVGHILDLQRRRRILDGLPSPTVLRIPAVFPTAMNEPADVELVVQNADASLLVAANRARSPDRSAWRRDAFGIQAREPLLVVAQRLGHSKVEMTLNIYARPTGYAARCGGTLGALLHGSKGGV